MRDDGPVCEPNGVTLGRWLLAGGLAGDIRFQPSILLVVARRTNRLTLVLDT